MGNHSDNKFQARKDFRKHLEALRLAISVCTAPALFTRSVQWSYNSICEPQFHSRAPHKRRLNLFAILMSASEPQSDTCQKHLLRFSCALKNRTVHLFCFASQFIINTEFPICGGHFFNFLLASSQSNHSHKSVVGVRAERKCAQWWKRIKPKRKNSKRGKQMITDAMAHWII